MGEAKWAELRAPFPPEHVGKLPKSNCRACSERRTACENHTWVRGCTVCGGTHTSATIHLDYVGHADVTNRLLEFDPEWSWEPMAQTPEGLPALDRAGNLWIRLTIAGVTRVGVGDGKSMKECIGDAIRNAAMRFGVALDLWAKGDREYGYYGGHDAGPRDPEPLRLSPTEAALIELSDLCTERGLDTVMVAQDYADGHPGKTLRTSTESEIRSYISLVRTGIPEMEPPTTGMRRVPKGELDAAENPADPEAARAARLEEARVRREAAGVDSRGRKRADEPTAERLTKVPAGDPFYTNAPTGEPK